MARVSALIKDNLTLYRLRVVLALYWISLCCLTHWPGLGTGIGHPFQVLQWDKIAHLVLFGLLMVLLIAARPLGRRLSSRATLAGALVIALVYSVLDEYTQGWTGRLVSMSDVAASFAGVLIVYLLMVATPDRTGNLMASRWVWRVLAVLLGVLVVVFSSQQTSQWIIQWSADASLNGHAVIGLLRSTVGFGLFMVLCRSALVGRERATLNMALAVAIAGLLPIATELVRDHLLGWGHARALKVWHVERGVTLAMLAVASVHAWRMVVLGGRTEVDLKGKPSGDTSGGASGGELPGEAPGALPGAGGFVQHARLFAGITLVSRLTGLVRDAALAAVFGLSVVADAFFIGFLIPNLFRRLFGEGALSAAFIPHYTELRQRDPALAKRFAWAVLTLLTAVLCGLTVMGEVLLFGVLQTLEPDGKAAMAVWLMMLMLPYMPLVCVVAMLGGVLQVHRKFGPPAAAPLVLNGCMIAGAWWAAWGHGARGELGAAYVLAVCVVLAGVLQLLWQGWEVLRSVPWQKSLAGTGTTMRNMFIMMGPMALGLGVYQINALLDSLLAFVLSPSAPETVSAAANASTQVAAQQTPVLMHLFDYAIHYPIEIGGVAAVQWSQRLYQFPLGVFGIAIATAVFPALAAAVAAQKSRTGRTSHQLDEPEVIDVNEIDSTHEEAQISEASEGETSGGVISGRTSKGGPSGGEFGQILRQGLRLTVFIGLPATVGMVILREPMVQLIYQRGAFTTEDTARVAAVLGWYALGIWAYSMSHVLTRAFYAFKDARTPLRISLTTVAMNFAMNLVLIWFLGIAGLALSTALSATLQVVLLLRAMRRRVDRLFDQTVWTSWLTTLGLSAAMGMVLLPMAELIDTQSMSLLTLLVWVLMMVGMGAGLFALGAWWRSCEEMQWLLKRR